MRTIRLFDLFLFALPLIVYVIAEYCFGVWIALIVSAVITMGQIIAVKLRVTDGCLSHYITDLILIAIFALIEITPYPYAISFLFISIVLFLSASGIINIFGMFGSLFDAFLANPYAISNMRKAFCRMGIWCMIGALTYFAAATILTDSTIIGRIEKWCLPTILLASMATEIIVGRINYYRYRKSEWVPLVNEQGGVVGQCPRPLVHNGSLWLHPVVHLHVVHNGQLLLQRRPMSKRIQPGKWDTAVGGHIAAGETIEKALGREVWEEIGLANFEARHIAQYVWTCSVEREYVFSFLTESAGPFEPKNIGEVDELRFWNKEELQKNIGKDVFTPNLERELTDWILANI